MPTALNSVTDRPDGSVTVLRDLLSSKALESVEWRRWTEPGRTGTAIPTLYETDDPQQATAQLIPPLRGPTEREASTASARRPAAPCSASVKPRSYRRAEGRE